MRRTSHKRVLEMLRRGPVCGSEFLRMRLQDFPGQVARLRHIYCCPSGVRLECRIASGYRISLEPCRRHSHGDRQFEYRLMGLSQPQNHASQTEPVPPPPADPEFEALIAQFGPARASLIAAGIEEDPR